jgi:F-type H+-transporting ATPase subunit b
MRLQSEVSTGIIIKSALLVIISSCLTLFAAEAGASGWGWWETVGRWVNLFILFGAIFYFVKQPVSRFFLTRRQEIRKEIQEAQEARQQAEDKLAEMEERMRNLDQELAAMRIQAQEEAEREKLRILEHAAEESKKIVAAAEREIDGLTRAARQDLRAYAVQLSVEMATEKINSEMDAPARTRVVDRFLIKLAKSVTED